MKTGSTTFDLMTAKEIIPVATKFDLEHTEFLTLNLPPNTVLDKNAYQMVST
jgi:hypothetical protein